MMKIRITLRIMFSSTNSYGALLSYALYGRHIISLLFSGTYLSRRKLWMVTTKSSCQRSFTFFLLYLYTHRTRFILRILRQSSSMKYRSNSTPYYHVNCLCRVCTTLRPNVLLRSNSYNEPSISSSLFRNYISTMSLRRILSRKSNSNPVLRIPLLIPFHSNSPIGYSSSLPSPNRL